MDQEEMLQRAWHGSSIIFFYETARDYLRFLLNTVIDESSAPALIEKLMDLYRQGSKLPRDEDIYRCDDMPVLEPAMHWAGTNSIRFRYSPLYWGCFNPFHDENGNHQLCLSADLGDIGDEMMKGIREYENGNSFDALGIWRDGWRLHWGQHAVSAIRVLHWMITEHSF